MNRLTAGKFAGFVFIAAQLAFMPVTHAAAWLDDAALTEVVGRDATVAGFLGGMPWLPVPVPQTEVAVGDEPADAGRDAGTTFAGDAAVTLVQKFIVPDALFDYELTVGDIEYRDTDVESRILEDGSIEVSAALPARIAWIRMARLRVQGQDAVIGDVEFRNITFGPRDNIRVTYIP